MFHSALHRAAVAGAVAALTLTGFTASRVDKAVELLVDGKISAVHVFGSTVADALKAQGIALGQHDVLVPAAGEPIDDGAQIVVRYGRKLDVTLDGQSALYWTTATTVEQALADLGIRADAAAALSVSRSQPLGREGLSLTVTNPRQVSVVVDGTTQAVSSTAATVAQLLTQLQVATDPLDRVAPAANTALTDGLSVVVSRVSEKTVTETAVVPFATTRQDDGALERGKTAVLTRGVPGERTVTYKEVWVDGQLESRAEASSQISRAATDQVVAVGTAAKAAPAPSAALPPAPVSPPAPSTPAPAPARSAPAPAPGGAGLNLANAAMWDRIAQCESGGNWHINTGNGYYGGLQFAASTWLSNGGADFASRADLASREQQVTVANRLYARAGLQPWGCRGAA